MTRARRSWFMFATVAAVIFSCSDGQEDAEVELPDGSEFSIDTVRSFDAYPLYFAGADWEGFKLETIRRGGELPHVTGGGSIEFFDYVLFAYGGCETHSDPEQCLMRCGDCHSGSFVITVWNAWHWFHEQGRDGFLRSATTTEIRGVPAYGYATTLVLFTENVAVEVGGFDYEVALEITADLEPANELASSAEALPQPIDGAFTGELECPDPTRRRGRS